MRFHFYQTVTKSDHIGYQYKTSQSLGVLSKNTYSGYHQKIAYCRNLEWYPMIYGMYFLSILFLYGGHVHIVNAKKEYTGFLKFFFHRFQLKKTTKILKNKTPIFHSPIPFEKKKQLLRSLLFQRKKKKQWDIKKKFPLSFTKQKPISSLEGEEPSKKHIEKKKKKFFYRFLNKRVTSRLLSLLKETYEKKGRKKIRCPRPFLTFSETGIIKGSLSNWEQSLLLAKQYANLQARFHHLFQWNRKIFQEYKRLGQRSSGFLEAPFQKKYSLVVSKKPDVIILINSDKNYGLVYENFRESIPLFGGIDLYSKKEWFDFPWPGNSQSLSFFHRWNCWIFQMYWYVQRRRFRKSFWYWKKGSFKKQK